MQSLQSFVYFLRFLNYFVCLLQNGVHNNTKNTISITWKIAALIPPPVAKKAYKIGGVTHGAQTTALSEIFKSIKI